MPGLLAGLLFFSCSKDRPAASGQDDASVRFGIDTRAEGVRAGTTYRIMFYYGSEDEYMYRPAGSGTYYLKNDGDEILTPCRIEESGPVDDNLAGLNGSTGTFYVFCVSPGTIANDDRGAFLVNPRKQEFITSERILAKDVGEYQLIYINRQVEYRTKIGIDFYQANNDVLGNFEISELEITGAGAEDEEVTIYPATIQVAASTDGLGLSLTPKQDGKVTDDNGNRLIYKTVEPVFIAPAIYAPKADVAELLRTNAIDNLCESDYLYMTCRMSQGGREPVDIRMPLTARKDMHRLNPQHIYRFRVIVSSDYIALEVDVFGSTNDWEDGGSDGAWISKPDYTVKLGTWKIAGNGENDWELVEIEKQVLK